MPGSPGIAQTWAVEETRAPAANAPAWLTTLGVSAWLVVGIFVVILGAIWLLALTSTITEPLIFGAVIGAVGGVLVDRMEDHRVPRAIGSALVMLGLALVGAAVVALVLGGITSQASDVDRYTSQAVDKVQNWLNDDLGVTSAQDAAKDVKKAVPDVGKTLLNGIAHTIEGMKSLLVFLGFTAFTSFFLLKDSPVMGRWIRRHMGVPAATAETVTGDLVHALRSYFVGLTIVGAFNATVIFLGALLLDVPLPGTIALVTFVASYVPFIGAWTAGFFAFALALASQGTTTAFAMALIVFLANGPAQQVVQPIAMGASLGLNPLVVFVVTIAGGCLFGMVGLILAAPLVSAGVHIKQDLAAATAARAPVPP
jgi:predicted PurR-regulated permease PerM